MKYLALSTAILLTLGCVQKIRLSADEMCALRYNAQPTEQSKILSALKKDDLTTSWRSYSCQRPKNDKDRCTIYRHKNAGYEKEKFNKWYDKNHTTRMILDGLILPWPFVEGYYKIKKNRSEKKARVAMFYQCPKFPKGHR